MTPKTLSKIEVKKMQDAMQFNIYTKQVEEEKTQMDQINHMIQQEEQATEVLKKDILAQNENMKQRLAERKRRSSLRDNSDTISCGLSS